MMSKGEEKFLVSGEKEEDEGKYARGRNVQSVKSRRDPAPRFSRLISPM